MNPAPPPLPPLSATSPTARVSALPAVAALVVGIVTLIIAILGYAFHLHVRNTPASNSGPGEIVLVLIMSLIAFVGLGAVALGTGLAVWDIVRARRLVVPSIAVLVNAAALTVLIAIWRG